MDRELRVAARSPGTFWIRVGAALVGLLIQTGVLIVSSLGPFASSPPGDVLFSIVTWMALVAVLSAGLFFTSDCLSAERREGTLGFLFLTDLRGYDIVGGKLVSTSLRSAYGLVAICPVVAVALLFGAVSGLQVLKTILALLNALFFSLAAGLWVSSISRDSQKALGATLLLILALVLGGPVGDALWSGAKHRAFAPIMSMISPAYVFQAASAWGRNSFWIALAASQATAWTMLALACAAVPRMWQARNHNSRFSSWMSKWKFGGKRRRAGLRRRWLDRDPILWLLCRERWQSDALWLLAILALGVFVSMLANESTQTAWTVWIPIWYLSVPVFYLWTASQACRFFLEARRSGLLELLLTSPVPEGRIVRAQWVAILRSFGCPLALLIAVSLAALCRGQFPTMAYTMAVASRGGTGPGWALRFAMVAPVFLTVAAGLVALVWFAMWMGMTSKNPALATFKTILFVKVIPWFGVFFISSLLPFVMIMSTAARQARSGSSPLPFMSGVTWPLLMAWLPAVLNIGIDLGLIALARRQLRTTLRQRAAGALNPVWVQPRGPVPPVIPSAVATDSTP